jgi:hypothetical protein
VKLAERETQNQAAHDEEIKFVVAATIDSIGGTPEDADRRVEFHVRQRRKPRLRERLPHAGHDACW